MKKVLIACQCATNKGDRAVAEYIISELKKEDISITLSTTKPELWESLSNDGIRVIKMGMRPLIKAPKNAFLKKVVSKINSIYYSKVIYPELISENNERKACNKLSKEYIDEVKNADIVIITGGHHITSIRNKNALFSFTYDIGLASLYSKEYVLWAQTIGPLDFTDDNPKAFFAKVIKNAKRVYIRDDNSEECLRTLIGNQLDNIYKTHDSVFGFGSLDFTPYDKRENKVGISIFNGLGKAFATYPAIARTLDYFASQGCSVEFFRMEHGDKELEAINKVIKLMTVKASVKIYPFGTSTGEHLKEMATCKYFVGYKTHSVIMALTTATPLIAICYHKKTRDFMDDYGLAQYAIDDETFTAENGIFAARKILNNAAEIHANMKEHSRRIAEAVKNDLRNMIND